MNLAHESVVRVLQGGRVALRLALAAPLLAPLVAGAGTPISKRGPADPAGQVEVSNVSGTVVVTGWNRSEVEVTGELGKGTERLEFTTSGKVTRVRVILPNRSHHTEETDLVIRVPAGSGLAVNTVSADIRVRDVTGAQRLQSVSADIDTVAAGEDVECKSVSGDVRVAGAGQRALLNITTVSGDATATGIAGEVNANTVSGNLNLGMGETSRSRLRSTSGDLTLAGKLVGEARLDVESMNGDVRLDFASPVDAEFDVSSFNGEIRNCFGPRAVRTSEYAPGHELRFREGRGTGRVRIKTFNGDISVCAK